MSLAVATDTTGDAIPEKSQELLKKFAWAIKQVTSENAAAENVTPLTQDELVELIKCWEPKRDIICLYVRWARQLRRNFNLDSIATLLCLSRQCDYTPVDFLRKVKTLSIHRNQKAAYGVTFLFDIPNRKDINREQLNKEFLGLSVTLSLLQEQVTESPSILGKTRMRQRAPRSIYQMNIPIDVNNNQHAAIAAHPTIEFHTQPSLLSRIWISINHRWLALYFTEHLFRESNKHWSYKDALVYSFQMLAPCGPGRFEFLSPLAGYCLRFRTQESIESKRSQLRQIWNDSSKFMSYGNTCLTHFSTEAKSRIILSCFQELRLEIPRNCKQISYQRDCSLVRRWTILCAYIFHFWLESATNSKLKSLITNQLAQHPTRKRRRSTELPPVSPGKIEDGRTIPLQDEPPMDRNLPKKSGNSSNGLQSILSSRSLLKKNAIPNRTACVEGATALNVVGNEKVGSCNNTSTVGNIESNAQLHHHTVFNNVDWSNFRLIEMEEMQKYVQSFMLIHRDDGLDILAELSPLEVYSANNLHDYLHCRLSGKAPFAVPSERTSPATMNLRNDSSGFIDRFAKTYHVARGESEYFIEHGDVLPSFHHIQLLCETIIRHGSIDSKRAVGQYRLNIGNGGQNWVNGAPCELHGLQFLKEVEKEGLLDTTQVLYTIGGITDFTWRVMCCLQHDANDHPIAPDTFRKQLYADRLCKLLHIENKEVGFEDITLVVSSLYPTIHQVSEHKDIMNDTLSGYTRTAVFNLVMIDDHDDPPIILHLQVICNFRKVIGHYVIPFYKYIAPVAKHAREYIGRWNRSIHSVYGGKTDSIPSLYDRSSIYLDDSLTYDVVLISEAGKHKQSISSEYILTEVNISRTLSLSMFIDSIVKLQPYLKFDQSIELAFACSFLSNPFWFDWTMSTLLRRLDDPSKPYKLGVHPFFDWSHTTIEIFGTWQGGPHNRWSPCGGSKETILETFGAMPTASQHERELGEKKLVKVVGILLGHLYLINSLSCNGNQPVFDMPLSEMKRSCDRTVKEIAQVASCQFSHFRLGIFTTVMSGCGLLKEGKHLRNLMYPTKGSASFKHLCTPVADVMSQDRARALGENKLNESISNDGEGFVHEDHHDMFMQYLSAELGFPVYVRDEMECILCESHPMRSLNCRDWFRKGMRLYDGNWKGEFFYKEYGKCTDWVKLVPPADYEFAYLGKALIKYIPTDTRLTCYAANFGVELRSENFKTKIKFKGRSSTNSSQQRTFLNSYNSRNTFSHPSMQLADFYSGSSVKKNLLKSMFVLDDAEHAVEFTLSNDLDHYPCGRQLYRYLHSILMNTSNQLTPTIAAGSYHMDSDINGDEVTIFPGHVDKAFAHTVWFVPIGDTPFFTILSVARCSEHVQDADSMRYFEEWKSRLSTDESKRLDEFLLDFDFQARKHTRVGNLMRLVYLNKRGSVLSFPANTCYHTTITPKKPKGFPRDMFIFHPLDGLS